MTQKTATTRNISWQHSEADGARLRRTAVESAAIPLGDKMIVTIMRHFPWWDAIVLHDYTFKSHHTDYTGAKADLEVFNEAGIQVLLGRKFHSGESAFWSPSRTSRVPEWHNGTVGGAAGRHDSD
jgi:hypothetical protein